MIVICDAEDLLSRTVPLALIIAIEVFVIMSTNSAIIYALTMYIIVCNPHMPGISLKKIVALLSRVR